MRAVAARLGSELRARWRGWIGLAVLAGTFGGIVLGAAAGARRTDNAYPRLLEETNASHFLISAAQTGLTSAFYDDVERLPGIADTGRLAGMLLLPGPDGPVAPDSSFVADASVDGRYGSSFNRPKLLAGRLPDPARPTETLVNRAFARAHDLVVGSEIPLLAPPAQYTDPSRADPVTFTVVGIGLFPREVVPGSLLDAEPRQLLTPAYFDAHRHDELNYDGIAVRLHAGVDRDAFRREVERLAEVHRDEVGEVFISDDATFQAKTQRAIRPQAVALALFALLAGAACLLVTGQTLSRQLSREAGEYPTLRALGMTRGQLVVLQLARAGAVAALGGALAVAVAVAGSPLMPIGPARLAEPDPGLAIDVAVLGIGFMAVVVSLVAWTFIPARRAASAPAGGEAAEPSVVRSHSRLAGLATTMGLPASTTAGIRMALEPGRGRTAVPVRSALVGTAVAIAAVVAAATFATNLRRLVSTPTLYGRDWDVALDTGFGAVPIDDATALLAGDPAVAGYTGGRYGEVVVGGQSVPAVGLDLLVGDVFPTLLEGRPPRGPGEVVFGTTTLRDLGRDVGDTTTVVVAGEASTMRIVGRAVFPSLGRGSFPPTGLGEGAAVAAELLPLVEAPPEARAYSFFLVRFTADAGESARGALAERFYAALCAEAPEDCFLVADSDQRPADISNYERVQSTPLVLAGLLALLAAATLGHTLLTAVRRRRRDLATLRAMGFVRRQVWSCISSQATTLAVLAVLVGLPLGVAAGRGLWLLFARQLGVAGSVTVPAAALLIGVPVTVLVANLVAAVPGWSAGRVRPAVVLRTE